MGSHRKYLTNRILAKFTDLFIVFFIAALLPRVVGPLLGFFYSLIADGLSVGGQRGQSIGKKIFRLQVVNAITDKPAHFRDSMIRNSPVGLATFFAIIPIWGWFILVVIGIPLLAIELTLMVRMENGHRLGDVMADTEVREVSHEK